MRLNVINQLCKDGIINKTVAQRNNKGKSVLEVKNEKVGPHYKDPHSEVGYR